MTVSHAHPPAQPAPASPKKKPTEFTADMSLTRAVAHLWPYVWPQGRLDLKLRSCLALSMMIVAKLVTLAVPFSFKWITDALVDKGTGALTFSVLAVPIGLTILYGALRAFM